MGVLDFISMEEIDDLPDDPRVAFVTLIRITEARLSQLIDKLDPELNSDWAIIEEARYSFVNIVIGASKQYCIEPLASMKVPVLANYDMGSYRQFKADLDHCLMQLMLDTSTRAKKDSVLLALKTRERIRSYIHGLRECIDKADLTDAKRDALYEKLSEFEDELDKRRLSLLTVGKVAYYIFTVPGALWGSYDAVTKLMTNIVGVVDEAAKDQVRQLAPHELPKALTAPRKLVDSPPVSALKDEIPF